jgi:hypothetical protein
MRELYIAEGPMLLSECVERLDELKGRFDAQLAALIQEGATAGEFHVRDPRTASLAVGGMVSWIYIWYRDGRRLSPSEIGAHMADYVMNLLGATATATAAPA